MCYVWRVLCYNRLYDEQVITVYPECFFCVPADRIDIELFYVFEQAIQFGRIGFDGGIVYQAVVQLFFQKSFSSLKKNVRLVLSMNGMLQQEQC